MARILLMLSAILVFKDVQCQQPPEYLAGTCKREGWNDVSMEAMKMMADAINFEKGKYSRAHRIPYSRIKQSILGNFPLTWKEYDGVIRQWKKIIKQLMDDIHTVDEEYFGYQKLKEKRVNQIFNRLTHENLAQCERYLEQIPEKRAKTDANYLAEQIRNLCICMYNAPGNIRPGYPETNNVIGDNYDPMLNRRRMPGERVTIDDLTLDSLKFEEKYHLDYKKHQNGIYSSDQKL